MIHPFVIVNVHIMEIDHSSITRRKYKIATKAVGREVGRRTNDMKMLAQSLA